MTKQKLKFSVTENQLKAITDVDHNLLVISGPGTGKTNIIAHKVAHLISLGYNASDILITTFTNKATNELRLRAAYHCKTPPHHLEVYTINSFCNSVLRDFSHLIDFKKEFVLLNDITQKFLLLERYNDISGLADSFSNEGVFQKYIFHLLGLFNSLNENLIDRRDIYKYIEKGGANRLTFNLNPNLIPRLNDGQIYKIFDNYRRFMGENRWLDHSQALKLVYNLIKDNKKVRDALQKRYKYILVDEFQDTSYIQNEIFKLLLSGKTKICAVGDDDQAIYQFRGASVDNILSFANNFDNVKTVFIEDNFRSTKNIVGFSNSIIKNSGDRMPKNIVSKRDCGSKVMLIEGNSYSDTAKLICDLIKRLVNKGTISSYSEVIVLFSSVRWDFIGKGYKAVFDNNNIPSTIYRSGCYFDNTDVRSVLELLIIFLKSNINNEELHFILDSLNLSDNSYEIIMNKSFDSIYSIKPLDGITDKRDIEKLNMFYNTANNIKTTNYTILSILYNIFELFDLFTKLINNNDENTFYQLAYMTSLAQSYELLGGNSLSAFVKTLDILRKKRSLEELIPDNNKNSVHISTIHNAKGLEYKIVFLCEFNTDKEWKGYFTIPDELLNYKASYTNQLRLFYVGITRAKDYLFLAYSKRDKFNNINPLNSVLKKAIDDNVINSFNWDELYLNKYNDKKNIEVFNSITLTYTAINCYLSCPLRYCFEYVYGFKTPSNESAVFGNIIHRVLERLHRSVSHSLSENLILSMLSEQIEFYGLGSGFMDMGRNMLLGYMEDHSSKFDRIYAVEKNFEVFFGNNRLTGSIDLILKNERNMVDIIDFKTGKIDDFTEDQLLTYACAYNMENEGNDNLVSSIKVHNLLENKIIDYSINLDKINRMSLDISNIFNRVMEKDFSPNPGISCSYCYFSSCCNYFYYK